jgi:hypothetical protein
VPVAAYARPTPPKLSGRVAAPTGGVRQLDSAGRRIGSRQRGVGEQLPGVDRPPGPQPRALPIESPTTSRALIVWGSGPRRHHRLPRIGPAPPDE